MQAVKLKSNEFWGSRSGAYDPSPAKGDNKPWGFYFRQQQWSSGGNRQTKPSQVRLVNVNKSWFKGGR